MAKVIYTLKITLFREEFALTKHEKRELIRFTTFIVTTYVEPWMSAHCSTSAPATDLALLKALAAYRDKEIGRASGKVMAGTCGTSPRSSSASPSSTRRRWSRRSGPSSAPCSSGWGKKNRLAAPTSPSTQWSSAPWRRLRRPTLSASSPPSGPVTIPQRRIRRVVGEGRLHHGSSARPSPTGGERLCGEGRRPHHAFCGAITRDEEQRQHLLQVVERHGRCTRARNRYRMARTVDSFFFDHRHQCRLVEV
ncbi:hypothetical protein GWK47_008916 [Chionoecetes opilio]|uniref:Uncharacterized protein n=1 Tax=Chionoecetes opilio TaxID=41210 RepID=A0A8J4Y3V1_CHIOP|nr:hypothetical protein GWK47_008916 [Chionoecetes opilio]